MIKIRPYAKEFLKKMKDYYEIIIFTASQPLYAETIIKELDPEKKFISYILDRSFCLETKNGFFIKDLRIFKNRDLSNIVIVDNLLHSFGFQIENGIPILEWTGNKVDEELKHLAEYLHSIYKEPDLRVCLRDRFRLMELSQAKTQNTVDI
jgi:CTD small phosphatase-like protein 2